MAPAHPEGYVSKYYEMDPVTEDLIRGSRLRNGMRVLIADPDYRADLDYHGTLDRLSGPEYRRSRQFNRWCVVTDLDTDDADIHSLFIGVYDDGSKFDFIMPTQFAWIVKINTMNQTDVWASENVDSVKMTSTSKTETTHFGGVQEGVPVDWEKVKSGLHKPTEPDDETDTKTKL